MSKYHVNPENGNAGPCRAKHKCPFGDLETDHYGSKLEAQQAYEKAMVISPHKISFDKALSEKVQLEGQELLALLSNDEGIFELPDQQEIYWATSEKGEDVEQVDEVKLGDFRLLASGLNINAYVNEKSMVVYKIPHFESVGDLWSPEVSELLTSNASSEARAYANIDHEALEANGVKYLSTLYTNIATAQGPLPIMAQPFLSPDIYEAHQLSKAEGDLVEALGLWDFNAGNVRRHKTTGQVVLIDCVPSWADEEYVDKLIAAQD